MEHKKFYLFIVIFVILSIGCSKINYKIGDELYCWPDAVSVKKGPDSYFQTIYKLTEGDYVIYEGEKTTNSNSVTIRNTNYQTLYIKVKTRDGNIGWVYECALFTFTKWGIDTNISIQSAVNQTNWKMIKYYLFHSQNEFGTVLNSMVDIAIADNLKDVMYYLLTNYLTNNYNGEGLIKAIELGNLDFAQKLMATYLISKNLTALNPDQYRNGENSFMVAAIKSGNIAVIQYLETIGLSLMGNYNNGSTDVTLLDQAINYNSSNMELIDYLISKGVGCSSDRLYGGMYLAAKYNALDLVKKLRGANIPFDYAIFGAIEGNNLDMLKYLVENGAEVNTVYTIPAEGENLNNINEQRPLDIALNSGNQEIIDYLKSMGANPTEKKHNAEESGVD